MIKYTQRFKEAKYPKITVDELRHLLFEVGDQEGSVKHLRQKLFKLNDTIINDRILNKL